ncbi:hypothetical protein FACS1894139_02930 [Planctomycetales bacterium]|nr:hypothetical protein FACS1894108_13370 [Planctomycetales bacterium]GHT03202.1 hypothetical protein FACS1894139_02930 [Planctomycetales bacterium]
MITRFGKSTDKVQERGRTLPKMREMAEKTRIWAEKMLPRYLTTLMLAVFAMV